MDASAYRAIYSLLSSEKAEAASKISPINIDNLRRETRRSVSNPRTSIPEVVAITSVADKFESHYTSTQVLGPGSGSSNSGTTSKQAFLKPMTELSRLALGRHTLKKDGLVRPITRLARLGMEKWLDSSLKDTCEEIEARGQVPW